MKSRIHAIAGITALLCIAVFWTSTVVSELFLGTAAIIAVKRAILYGIVILVAAMATAGATGFALAGKRQGTLIEKKKRRMPIIAATGLLVMIPLATYLAVKAGAGELDTRFYAAQLLELAVGIMQMSLIGLSLRDGLRLGGRLRPDQAAYRA